MARRSTLSTDWFNSCFIRSKPEGEAEPHVPSLLASQTDISPENSDTARILAASRHERLLLT